MSNHYCMFSSATADWSVTVVAVAAKVGLVVMCQAKSLGFVRTHLGCNACATVGVTDWACPVAELWLMLKNRVQQILPRSGIKPNNTCVGLQFPNTP